MATARPFAYNTGSTISGTEQIGDLAIGYPDSGYEASGVKWWNGPDEDLGYVIAYPDPSGLHTSSTGINGFIGFRRSEEKTDQSFLNLANLIAGESGNFDHPYNAKVWLENNGFWASWEGSPPPANKITLEYILVGGGGSGGGNSYGGGGGAGGVVSGTTLVAPGSNYSFPVVIGGGGTDTSGLPNPGNVSTAFNICAFGGGGGARADAADACTLGRSAIGSGGGGAPILGSDLSSSGGTGSIAIYSYFPYSNTTYCTTIPQGNNGGTSNNCCLDSSCRVGGGGGGFLSSGCNATTTKGGDGGNGTTWFDNIGCVAGGGGGGVRCNGGTVGYGSFGGGDGGKTGNGCNALANSGSGGGGSGYIDTATCGGNGGSGIFIFRYSGNTTLFSGGTTTTCNNYTYHCVTSSCTISEI